MSRPHRPIAVITSLSVLCLLSLAWALPPAAMAQAGYQGSRWWDEVKRIDRMLESGSWKRALRVLDRQVPEILRLSWSEPDLDRVLGRLALQRAIANANLGNENDALWYWHTAQNLDKSIADTDLAPYGKAAALFASHPLRQPGAVPAGRDVKRSPFFASGVTPPRAQARDDVPTVLENTAARDQYVAPVRVEVIIDAQGRLQQPVVEAPAIHHPAVLYGTLETIRSWSYDPATQDGKPVDCLYEVEMDLSRRSRW